MNHQKIEIFWRKLWITKEKIKLYSRLVNPFGKILTVRDCIRPMYFVV